MAWPVDPRPARSLLSLKDQIDRRWPDRSTLSDGMLGDEDHQNRSSDHNPWYGPGIVTAIDITHDPDNGVDIDKFTDELVSSRDPRIKYVIANRLIADSRPVTRTVGGREVVYDPWTWLSFGGSNPHTKHVHLSVVASPLCDDTRSWDLASLSIEGGKELNLETEFTDWADNPQTYKSYMDHQDERSYHNELAVKRLHADVSWAHGRNLGEFEIVKEMLTRLSGEVAEINTQLGSKEP